MDQTNNISGTLCSLHARAMEGHGKASEIARAIKKKLRSEAKLALPNKRWGGFSTAVYNYAALIIMCLTCKKTPLYDNYNHHHYYLSFSSLVLLTAFTEEKLHVPVKATLR